MGVCSTTESKSETTKRIEEEMKEYSKQLHNQVKLLLLGPGESGKSTIFKQMKIIQDDGGFDENERCQFKNLIYINCVSQMKVLIEAAIATKQNFEKKESLNHAQNIMKIGKEVQWSSDIAKSIDALWKDKGIREVFTKKGKTYQLNDTAEHFLDNVMRYAEEDFIPTTDDVLRVRVRSAGIEEAEFRFDKKLFKVVDVGGQRSERRKWIHCFDGVTLVLYCASLIGYDLMLREDEKQNRMIEAIMLFQEVVNSANFCKKPIVLFLNKTDLFKQKLPKYPLKETFPTYTGNIMFVIHGTTDHLL
eukprot:TRINITY_DN2672_c0_g1_i1.p1 TRINITY_DN2672_c0_g1~~TRINITY_DN2672_c0_g1_i1.p1  ORF type:complete len:304 (-),score=45.77 TRINITY_DN2672_c0_g1_i1:832-1743(-)